MQEEKKLLIEHGILDSIYKDARVTQSELSRTLSISIGLCNAYLKRLINKGYIKVANFKAKNIRYLLTPDGIAQKVILTRRYMLRSLDYYKVLKNRCEEIITELKLEEVRTIAIIGTNEVAEIFYLYLQNSKIEIKSVYDNKKNGQNWFDFSIKSIKEINATKFDKIINTDHLLDFGNNKTIQF